MASLAFKLPRGDVSHIHHKKNPAVNSNNKINTSIDPKMRGPAGQVAQSTMQYQFLNSLSSTGDSGGVTPANRQYMQATNLDMKRRLQSAQNVLGLTKKQIAMNEKSGSGKSNFVTTQQNYTTDFFQLPTSVNSFIPEFTKENIPYYVGGMLLVYIVLFKK